MRIFGATVAVVSRAAFAVCVAFAAFVLAEAGFGGDICDTSTVRGLSVSYKGFRALNVRAIGRIDGRAARRRGRSAAGGQQRADYSQIADSFHNVAPHNLGTLKQ